MSPLQGQSEAQQRSDAEECDSEAKTLSGYDRGVEAKTWLWGIPATVGVVTTWAAQTAVNTVTVWPVPEVQEAASKTANAIIETKPNGNATWGGYFQLYRGCMSQRGYVEAR